MQEKANILKKQPRLYTIEFLKVFFMFFIILGHCMGQYPDLKNSVLAFFHTKSMQTWFGVEFFFIIGGFFLYRKVLSTKNIFGLIKKIYVRLLPALLFVFLLCVASGTNRIYQFPAILSLTTGLSIPGEVTGWGDWYVGVYFWCSLLFIGLFSNNIKRGFFWTAVLSYFALCLEFNAPNPGFVKTYYTVIGSEILRAVYSMGIGAVAAYLAEKVDIPRKTGSLVFFTVIEAGCFVLVFNYIARASHNHLNLLEMEVVFAILLISVANSLGYISGMLNKISKVQLVSRYTYAIFLGHIPFIKYLSKHQNWGLDGLTCYLIVCMGGALIGVFEYHVVEQKIVPWIGQYFQGDKE
ncbi:acyltransferase family protein [Candidatus Avelusimicrobium faecicola]|uniref:acyltransferase family protein n=1 Tax=Candidatus Avelusimicrobium faecicola TaxID=3416205 RepID=UPI003C9856DC|nr:acyltransferase [Spirochaetota bacterium]